MWFLILLWEWNDLCCPAKLGRKFIGLDLTPIAVTTAKARLDQIGVDVEEIEEVAHKILNLHVFYMSLTRVTLTAGR